MTRRSMARDDYSKVTLEIAPDRSRAKFRAVDYDGEVEFHVDIVDLLRLRYAVEETIKDLVAAD